MTSGLLLKSKPVASATQRGGMLIAAAPRLAPHLVLLVYLGLALLLSACGRDLQQADGRIPLSDPARYAEFAPSFDLDVRPNNIMPYPNNLLFRGSTDGTINAPIDLEASNAAMLIPLNTLDGFSTIAPLTASFNVKPDVSTLIAGTTVRVFEVEVDSASRAVTEVVRELASSEYTVGPDLNTLAEQAEPVASGVQPPPPGSPGIAIVPTRALAPRSSYMVILTDGLKDQNGQPFAPSAIYALTKLNEPLIDSNEQSRVQNLDAAKAREVEDLRPFTLAAENAALAFDSSLTREQIILSWSFTTQSIDDSLLAVRAAINSAPPPPTTLALYADDKEDRLAFVYTGTITLPYYLAVPSEAEPEAPLSGFWHGTNGSFLTHANPMPQATVVKPIPLLVTIPKTSKPEGGWPVVIFQHGNTSNRTALVALCDKLAAQGFAAVAIDLPMHGLTGDEADASQPLYQAGLERTFDLDLINNETSIPGSDGVKDPSGTYFTKLNQVLTTRDNIRQGAADLMGLRRSLAAMDYDGGGADFNLGRVHFVGHSLGATVGAVYLGVEAAADVGASTLGMPGGAIAKQLDGSRTSGPSIALGMKENGLEKGTQDYERFLAAVQMVLDSADPLNYARSAVRNRPLHMIEVVGGADLGGGVLSLPDQIVPNHVLDAPDTVASPTGGTDPLWHSMGLSIAAASTSAESALPGLQVVVRFNAGHHSSLISTFDAASNADELSARVQEEMQSQIASFVSSNGLQLSIADSPLVVDH